MIISKNVLAISKVLITDDPFAADFVAFKRDGSNLIAYACNGYVGIKVVFPEYAGEEYPLMDNSYSVEHRDKIISFDKKTCAELMKITKKSHLPILNHTILVDETSFDEEKEQIRVFVTDLDSSSLTSVPCKNGKEMVDSLEIMIEAFPDTADSCKEVGFNPFYVSDMCLIIAEVLGIKRKEPWAVRWNQPMDKYHAIFLKCERNGITVEALVMPRVDS